MNTMPASVVQDWLAECCTWKEQTVVLCAIRGTDAGGSAIMKAYTCWIRRVALKNAAPEKTFMKWDIMLSIQEIAASQPLVLDMLPVHFVSHLMHAMQVIGYRHPDSNVSSIARQMYRELCDFLHVNEESPVEMTVRLKDEL